MRLRLLPIRESNDFQIKFLLFLADVAGTRLGAAAIAPEGRGGGRDDDFSSASSAGWAAGAGTAAVAAATVSVSDVGGPAEEEEDEELKVGSARTNK